MAQRLQELVVCCFAEIKTSDARQLAGRIRSRQPATQLPELTDYSHALPKDEEAAAEIWDTAFQKTIAADQKALSMNDTRTKCDVRLRYFAAQEESWERARCFSWRIIRLMCCCCRLRSRN